MIAPMVLAVLGQAASMPAQMPHGVLYDYSEAAQLCDSMGGMGELTVYDDFAQLADLNGDGVSDIIVDYSAISCSDSASLYASGSSGFALKVYLGGSGDLEPAYGTTVRGWSLIETADGPALELTTAGGASCGTADRSQSCTYRVSWYRDGFLEGPMRAAR
ncbi:hypothetical protein AAG607_12740 [Citromicrobium bathyomarinum]|uniref:hypothetical protein n=1 Tax=Sphingomonadales TaxID=204457 RepID=UPI002681B5AC